MTQTSSILSRAILFAADKHRNQTDKSGVPYILHPIKVMTYLNTEDQELMAIAVLHDVVEDCKVTFTDLWMVPFTDRIVEGVRGMTKIPGETVNDNLRRMMENIDVVDVKLCDLRHNMEPWRLPGIEEKDRIRMNKYMYMYRLLTTFKTTGRVEESDWKLEYGPIIRADASIRETADKNIPVH